MKLRVQIALLIAAFLYMGWGLALLLAPEASAQLLSEDPYNRVTTRMLGAMMLAWTIAFCIAARRPTTEIVQASIVALFTVGVVVMLLMTFGQMRASAPTKMSLWVNLGAGILLLASEFSGRRIRGSGEFRNEETPADSASRPAPKRPAAKAK